MYKRYQFGDYADRWIAELACARIYGLTGLINKQIQSA